MEWRGLEWSGAERSGVEWNEWRGVGRGVERIGEQRSAVQRSAVECSGVQRSAAQWSGVESKGRGQGAASREKDQKKEQRLLWDSDSERVCATASLDYTYSIPLRLLKTYNYNPGQERNHKSQVSGASQHRIHKSNPGARVESLLHHLKSLRSCVYLFEFRVLGFRFMASALHVSGFRSLAPFNWLERPV